jgi:hypothetical protein
MTNFAVLTQGDNAETSSLHATALSVITYIGIAISVPCMLLCVLAYLLYKVSVVFFFDHGETSFIPSKEEESAFIKSFYASMNVIFNANLFFSCLPPSRRHHHSARANRAKDDSDPSLLESLCRAACICLWHRQDIRPGLLSGHRHHPPFLLGLVVYMDAD